jgi:protein-serine/threonine kinase
MGLSRKNSSVNTPSLARAQPSTSHLNGVGKNVPIPNGASTPGHDKIHSTNTSTPSSPAASIGSGSDSKELKYLDNVSNGPTSPDKPGSASKDKSDKNPMSRITRMFSQSGREKEKEMREKEKDKELERRKLQHQHQQQHPQPSHPGGTSPMHRHSEKDGESSSDTDSAQSRGSSVAGDRLAKSTPVSSQHKNGDSSHLVRFEILEDGVDHVHHLRAAKRQEKLLTLLQSWLGGGQKKKDDEAAHLKDQLSLMNSWVDQWKTEKAAAKKIDNSQPHSATLVEKYGRCQEIIGRGMFHLQ